MFDFRQERFDEIHEAETRFFSRAEPRVQRSAPIFPTGFQPLSWVQGLTIGCYVFVFAAAVAPFGAVIS